MAGRMNGCIVDGRMVSWSILRMVGMTDGFKYGWLDGQITGWTDGWLVGWFDGRSDGEKHSQF